MRTKLINRIQVELTAAENAARDLEEQEWAAGAFGRAMLQLRQQRNQKLVNSDYRALSDQTLTQEWADYRQALRDITQDLETLQDVDSVIWPTEPK